MKDYFDKTYFENAAAALPPEWFAFKPVIGVILGVMFGDIVFIIIPIGNIVGGAVHDFTAGMMSIRHNGANLPKLVEDSLGTVTAKIFGLFVTVILLLVVAVFVNVPAGLIAEFREKVLEN